jgi:nucleotide-binding universal stress UspA family protein
MPVGDVCRNCVNTRKFKHKTKIHCSESPSMRKGSSKILVPHDGHAVADKALDFGIKLAKSMNLRIVILRVIPEPIHVSDRALHVAFLDRGERDKFTGGLKRLTEEEKVDVYKELTRLVDLCTAEGVKASRKVAVGSAVEKILETADKEKPYAIVMGSKRLEGLGKLRMIGSVARSVSELSKVPVTIVH